MAENDSLDAALAWLERAELLGFYTSNVARLIRAGAEAVKGVLQTEEERRADYILEQQDAICIRLMNKAERLNADTVKTYVSRVRRLLLDHRMFLSDPKGFRPTTKRGRGPGKSKRTAETEQLALVAEPALPQPPPVTVAPPLEGYRDHVIHLSTGKAMLRIPASLSADDVMLLTLIIKSHGPTAPPVGS